MGVTCQQRMLTPPMHLTQYTSGICRGPCKLDFYCKLFHLSDLDTDLDCRYSVYLTGHTDFDWVVPFPWSRHTYFDYWILRLKWGTQRVWPIDRGYLLPDTYPTSGFSRGTCLLNFLDLCVFLTEFNGTDHHCTLYYFFILMERNMTVWCQRR